MATTSPAKEDLDAYREALTAAYAALDETKTDADLALDAVQAARDEARRMYGTPEATSFFSDTFSNINLAARAIADAIDGLPALDEGGVEEEGASEANS